ncbi:tRNA (adenosine(37)-N6)-threonylcarbamoyltransferase complex dimerization subunit type 1 TsaB [Acidipila sp. EB88]|nr:tRNA (adenosine(37)-N6)-threonylcarbamoyltransferase complex dimerization subunit type 1 TsaB [Acidipila sp. EB88]
MPGLVLSLDACGTETTLALGRVAGTGVAANVLILREVRLGARTAGAQITQALDDALGSRAGEHAAGSPLQSLAAIVVVRGPGSFTGMRIGLSAAKALSEALNVPLFGVSRLAVLAAREHAPRVALYAGRGNVYLRAARGHEDAATECLLAAGEAGPTTGLVVCEEKVETMFAGARRVAEPTAADALRYASGRIGSGRADDAATLDALYLWQAEQMLGAPTTVSPVAAVSQP